MSRFCPPRFFLIVSVFVGLSFVGSVRCAVDGDLREATFNELSNPAKNLARINCGATIELATSAARTEANVATPATLLLDDDTLSYPLEAGETTFIISFPRVSALDRFTFVNENAAAQGDVTLSVSNYRLSTLSSKWNEAASNVPFSGKRVIDSSLLGVEARYVKVTFHAVKGGRVAALGLYGGQSLQKFGARQRRGVRMTNTVVTRRLEDMLNFNFANVYAKARIVYVSSGSQPSARRMIDDDVVTSFEFAAADRQPTVIVELADRERLHRVSAVYKMQRGTLEVFLLPKLASNPGDLTGHNPVASVTDETTGGKAAVEFDPRGARYVALRWTPAATEPGRGFEVAEVSAFGEVSLSMLNTAEGPDIYAENILGTTPPIVQPPMLPIVSP
jgi:hypothetical protein